MSPAIEKIRDEIRHLPFAARARLVRDLEQDLDADEPASSGDVEQAWDEEEENRADDVMSGKVQLMNSDDLARRLDEIRARHTA